MHCFGAGKEALHFRVSVLKAVASLTADNAWLQLPIERSISCLSHEPAHMATHEQEK